MATEIETLDCANSRNDESTPAWKNLAGAEIEFSQDELTDITSAASKLKLVGDQLHKAYLDMTGR